MNGGGYIQTNKEAYDNLAEDYRKRIFSKGKFEESVTNLVDFPVKHLDKKGGGNVLEIGPGSGEVLCEFERRGFSTTAVDISPNIIGVAKEVSSSTVFINANILDVEFSEGKFDIIYAGALIHLFTLDDALVLLKKIKFWIKATGVVFVNTTVHDTSSEGFLEKTDYSGNVKRFRRNWKEDEFVEAITNCGFRVIEKTFTNEEDRGKRWVGLVLRKEIMAAKRKNLNAKFKGNTLSVVRAEVDGLDLEFVDRREVSLVIPILDNGEILMVKQYRVSIDQEVIEFPGGKVEDGENPIDAANRELEEETGYVASDLSELITFYPAPHFTNEKVRIFVARGLSKKGNKSLEVEEQIESFTIKYSDLVDSVKKKILDAKTLIGITELEKLLNHEKI